MDIITKVGQRTSTEGTGTADSSQTQTGNVPPVSTKANNRGDNLIDKVGKKPDPTTEQVKVEETETNKVSGKEESPGTVTDPDSWTKESALKEMKKAREEAKATRLKYEESVQKLKDDAEVRIAAAKKEQEELRKAAEKLARLEADQEDKKRDLSEKVAHREALIEQLKASQELKERTFKDEQEKIKVELERYRAEAQAQAKVHEQRLNTEMESIPDKFKDIANYIVKGAGDPRDALLALNEAKLKGLFEEKTVVVNHSVPGAADGARSSKDRLDEAVKAERSKLSSQQKIGEALKNIRGGENNSAFRIR